MDVVVRCACAAEALALLYLKHRMHVSSSNAVSLMVQRLKPSRLRLLGEDMSMTWSGAGTVAPAFPIGRSSIGMAWERSTAACLSDRVFITMPMPCIRSSLAYRP